MLKLPVIPAPLVYKAMDDLRDFVCDSLVEGSPDPVHVEFLNELNTKMYFWTQILSCGSFTIGKKDL